MYPVLYIVAVLVPCRTRRVSFSIGKLDLKQIAIESPHVLPSISLEVSLDAMTKNGAYTEQQIATFLVV